MIGREDSQQQVQREKKDGDCDNQSGNRPGDQDI
jgi:hypothetical protein